MKLFMAVIIVFGSLIVAGIATYLFATALYFLIALIVLVRLLVSKQAFQKFLNYLDKESNYTKDSANKRWYSEYVKHVIRYYFRLFFCDNRIAKAKFQCLYKCGYKKGYNQSDKNVIDLTPIPFNKQPFNCVHTDNLSQGEKVVNHKQTEPKTNNLSIMK